MAELTRAPRGYGFHATLAPPMRLATGWPEFLDASERIAAAHPAFPMPRLQVVNMDGFLALTTPEPCTPLHRLADACVSGTDRHRLRPDAAELARRRATGLSPEQDALLLRWGYPYVMSEWRFHITLTRRLSSVEMALLLPAAERHFAGLLSQPRLCSAICVFTQINSGDFLIAERMKLNSFQ